MNAPAIACIAFGAGDGRFAVDIGTAELYRYRAARTIRAIGADAALMADIGAGERHPPTAATARIQRSRMVDHPAADRDMPARATDRIARIDTAAIDHFAVGGVARRRDHNLTILRADRLRLQVSIVGNQAIDNRLPCRRRECDRSTIRGDHAMVLHQLRRHRIRHRHFHQPITVQIHRRRVARGQMHFAQLRGDTAVIDDVRRHKPYQPGIFRGDAAVVHNRGIAGTFLVKRQGAIIHERIVMDIGGAHHQPIHIGARTGAEYHAILVDDNHIAVGDKIAIDMACAAAIYPVQRNAVAARLHKARGLAGSNIKSAPVDHRFVAGLVHRQRIARAGDARLSRRHHTIFRIRARKPRQQTKQRRRRQAGARG